MLTLTAWRLHFMCLQATSPVQCVAQCQPSCQPSCILQQSNLINQQPPAIVTCSPLATSGGVPSSGNCICSSGYMQCMQGACCLRKRHRAARKAWKSLGYQKRKCSLHKLVMFRQVSPPRRGKVWGSSSTDPGMWRKDGTIERLRRNDQILLN